MHFVCLAAIMLLFRTSVWASSLCPTSEGAFDADVLILGAGLAGIAAAKSLHERGIENFIILEANDRIGGRLRSTKFGGTRVELGAQVIGGLDGENPDKFKENPLWKLVKHCGIKGQLANLNSRIFYQGSKRVSDFQFYSSMMNYFNKRDKVRKYSEEAQRKHLPDISVRQALLQSGWTERSPVEKFISWSGFDFPFGANPNQSSLYSSFPVKIITDFGTDIFLIADKRGSEHLVNCLAGDFNLIENDPRLILNTIVKEIEWNNHCVCVTAKHKKRYCAQKAIITFSLGMLQSKNLRFIPPLPDYKQKAISAFQMTHIKKIFVKFNHTFWDMVMFIDRADDIRGRFPVMQPLGYFEDIPEEENILQFWLASTQAQIASSLTVEEIKKELMQVLRETYPHKTIPQPVDILVTNWESDPLNGGAFSNKPFEGKLTRKQLSVPVGQLYFSGEATHPDYSGTLHGALHAGFHTASKIITNNEPLGSI